MIRFIGCPLANFPGIDSVLSDGDGNLFTIQVTIAEDHNNPEKGFKKLWLEPPSEVRIGRTWNFVICQRQKRRLINM